MLSFSLLSITTNPKQEHPVVSTSAYVCMYILLRSAKLPWNRTCEQNILNEKLVDLHNDMAQTASTTFWHLWLFGENKTPIVLSQLEHRW